jgi:predicted RNA binding protein YcfA (HicA-like mRNA interferase family)
MPDASISRKVLIKKLKSLGYSGPFSGGRHQFMIKSEKKIRIPNPHKGQSIHISPLKEILRQAGINNDEWDSA